MENSRGKRVDKVRGNGSRVRENDEERKVNEQKVMDKVQLNQVQQE